MKSYQLSRYSPKTVSDMRARMKKFVSGLSCELVLKIKASLLIKYIIISRLVMYN